MLNSFSLSTDQLKTLLVESATLGSKNPISRPDYLDWVKKQSQNNFVKVLVGFRRVGKSTILKQFYRYLIDQRGFPVHNIFFVNFESDQLLKLTDLADLRALFEQFKTEVAKPGKIYLFLDEIQNVRGWEKFVRTLYETDSPRYNIYLTGSNSSLLSSEFSSALSGRSIEKRVYPFSFPEYLLYHNLSPTGDFWYQQHKEAVDRLLFSYLTQGALPESFDLDQETHAQYMQSVFNKVLLDDIIKRYQVKHPSLLADIFRYVVSNVNHPLNMSSISQAVSAGDSSITVPTIKRYLDMYQSTFALSSVSKFDWKTKSVFRKQLKYYPIDNGLLTTFASESKILDSMLLETLVFNHLLRRGGRVFFGRDDKGRELDFVVQNKDSWQLYQVSWRLTASNMNRELGNFSLASKYLPAGENILITMTGAEELAQTAGSRIRVLPLMKFLLDF